MNNHVIIIGLIITAIVIIQTNVYMSTKKKISLFRSVIPKATKFKTIQVFIPEDKIKDILPMEILNNLRNYSSIPSQIDEFKIVESNLDNESDNSSEISNSELRLIEDPEEYIHIGLDLEKKRIKRKNLELWESEGWSIITQERETYNN